MENATNTFTGRPRKRKLVVGTDSYVNTTNYKKTFHGYMKAKNEQFIASRSLKTAKYIRKSPEGAIIEFGLLKTILGQRISKMWRFLPRYFAENYNSENFGGELPKKFLGKRVKVPSPLPLPQEWRNLLPERVTLENFSFDFENEWVHTHFVELYELGKKYGSVYIEPSKDFKKVFFLGTGDYACHYFLELDK